MAKLRAVAQKYDSKGVFLTRVPGGFKVFGVGDWSPLGFDSTVLSLAGVVKAINKCPSSNRKAHDHVYIVNSLTGML